MKKDIVTSLILFSLLIFCQDCRKDPELLKKEKLTGQALKGPFITGSMIQLFELNSKLNQTGKVFSAALKSDDGLFEFNEISLVSGMAEFNVSGYYFNEVSGELSGSTLNLSSISDITNTSNVNINIITHLEKERLKYLVSNKKSFSEAKKDAENEILRAFGFEETGIENFESLNFYGNTDGNGILLAISLILQGERSVAELTELLSLIANDLEEDGTIDNQEIFDQLRISALSLSMESIRSNISNRFQQLNIEADIPDFEKYINIFLSFTGIAPQILELTPTEINTTSVQLNGSVIANDLNTSVSFEYGLNVTYGNIVNLEAPVLGHLETPVSAVIINLNPKTTYHYRIKAINSKGTVYSGDNSFLTLGDLPSATTLLANEIFSVKATLNGSVNPNYLTTSIVFEYGTSSSYGSSVSASSGTISNGNLNNVKAIIYSLVPSTVYHYRVIATNMIGTTYGSDQTFLTNGIIKDIDNNSYETVVIGTQTWMAENLKTTKLTDGTPIALLNPGTYINPVPGYCYYNNDVQIGNVYGALYNGYAVLTGKLCPTGWHIPNSGEFRTLLSVANSNALKEAGLEHWLPCVAPYPYCNPTNSSGFRALPGGSAANMLTFGGLHELAYFWGNTNYHIDSYEALRLNLTEGSYIGPSGPAGAFSVRCVKN